MSEDYVEKQNHPLTKNYEVVTTFFLNDSVLFHFDSPLCKPDVVILHIKAYGLHYTIEYITDRGFIFCCEEYKEGQSLIDAINKKCRGK